MTPCNERQRKNHDRLRRLRDSRARGLLLQPAFILFFLLKNVGKKITSTFTCSSKVLCMPHHPKKSIVFFTVLFFLHSLFIFWILFISSGLLLEYPHPGLQTSTDGANTATAPSSSSELGFDHGRVDPRLPLSHDCMTVPLLLLLLPLLGD